MVKHKQVSQFFEKRFNQVSQHYNKRLMLTNLRVISFAGTLTHIGFVFLFAAINVIELSVLNMFSVLIWATTFYTGTKGRVGLTLCLLISEMIVHAVIATAFLGSQWGFHFYLWPAMGLLLVLPTLHPKFFTSISVVLVFTFTYLSVHFQSVNFEHTYSGISYWMLALNILGSALPFIFCLKYFLNNRLANDRKLFEMANIDDFTHTYNRRFIYDLMNQPEEALNQAGIVDYAVILGDIDNLRVVNEKYGHGQGEELILAFTDVLKKHLKDIDLLARWSGQEFLLILNSTDKQDVLSRVAEMQISLVRDIDKPKLIEHEVTMSFGVGCSHTGKSFNQILQQADLNLSKAKDSGKDTIVADEISA